MTSRGPKTLAVVIALLACAGPAAAQSSKAGAPSPSTTAGAAPSPEELKAARELFASAYRDEQEKRFAEALEKFQRVAAVKESASVRYRIGAVLEQLGRLRESRDAFRALAASKPTLPAGEQEIADSSAERAHQLDKRIPGLVIKLQDRPPPDARVSIDGAPVPVSTAPRRVELDPGEHVVQASSPTTSPSESRVTLLEGNEIEVTVVLEAKGAKKDVVPPPPPVSSKTPHRNSTLAFVALGAGGVLLITGIALLAVRQGDISDINQDCRNSTCPPGRRSELQSTHDEATLFGPLGVVAGLLGLGGLGFGSYLLLRPAPVAAGAAPATGPTTSAPADALRIGTSYVHGGAAAFVTSTF